MYFLEELNDRQREAAETLNGPLLIVAGAGSGKTRTLTYRIANLIDKGIAMPWQILAVTFTNKAANEMKKRVQLLLQKEFGDENASVPMIGTFHSVCLRILWKHFDKAGRKKSFVVYDTTDTENLMKRLIKEKQIDDEKMKPKLILGMISKCKNRLQDASIFEARAGNHFERTVAELFAAYEKRLKENNAVDFDDLIMLTVKLFQKHPEVLDEYQERWRFINVDEYQDTNHAQYTLTKLLAGKYQNLCVIGDSDQSIYAFRGADISNILDFEKDYPEAKIVKLEQNYRSTQNILDAADAVIEKNKQRKKKKMWTDQKEGDLIEVIHAGTEQEEAKIITEEIENLISNKVSMSEIVILYRTNAQSRIIEEALLRYGMPYKVIGGVRFYARKEIKDLLAYLRVILNPYDTDSLLRIINVPSRRIGQATIKKLQVFALGRSLKLAELMNHVEMVDELNDKTRKNLANFWAMFDKWRIQAKEKSVSEITSQVVRDIGYKDYLQDGTEEGEMRYENILELISVASKYDGLEPELSLISFLEEVALVAETDKINHEDSLITMMTLHSVKGLEYPYVFIAGCEENIFPHSRSLSNEKEMEEERRLMYVGVTRAMKKLYLLAAKRRMLYGDYQSNRLSRFIDDIPEHLMNSTGTIKGDTVFEVPKFKKSMPFGAGNDDVGEKKFDDGDKVVHPSFGEGMIVERRGDLVTVAFENKIYGIKKFAANIAPLEKISQ